MEHPGFDPSLKGMVNRDLANGFVIMLHFCQLPAGFGGAGLEPKAVYRVVKGADNIRDTGANFTFVNNRISLSGMYHS